MQDWTKDQKQLDLFWQRSQAAGVNRRDFMKILAAASATAALAACAPGGAPAPAGGEVSSAVWEFSFSDAAGSLELFFSELFFSEVLLSDCLPAEVFSELSEDSSLFIDTLLFGFAADESCGDLPCPRSRSTRSCKRSMTSPSCSGGGDGLALF